MTSMSSIDHFARSRRRFAPRRIAGVSVNDQRCETKLCSCASVPATGNTQRSRAMPIESAQDAEHTMSAAAMSTSLFEFINFV